VSWWAAAKTQLRGTPRSNQLLADEASVALCAMCA
jgi:hypothetical protein